MRQIRKQILTLTKRYGIWLAFSLLALLAVPVASAREQGIVIDPLTGVALSGYDPVSYFTQSAPQPGRAEYEVLWGGVSWYFASAANRDVFLAAPEVYAPRWGGHCAMALARGYLSEGNPLIYVLYGQRLYLFHSVGNREAFGLSGAAAIAAASAVWEALPPARDVRLSVPGREPGAEAAP